MYIYIYIIYLHNHMYLYIYIYLYTVAAKQVRRDIDTTHSYVTCLIRICIHVT